MVKSEKIYSAQNFVCKITGECYVFTCEDTTSEIQEHLIENGYELWDYPLSEIDHIVENDINVVLVDVSGFNENGDWKEEYRWFELPEEEK